MNPDSAKALSIAATATGVFLLYAITASPHLTGGDSGELIAAAAGRGVAHPPGYPLWTLLGHLFAQLPFQTLAWRISLFSVCCGTAAAVLLMQCLLRWSCSLPVAVSCALLYAASPLTWTYSIQAEVFALNNCLVALILFYASRFAHGHRLRDACLTALACGLAASNHHTSVFLFAPIAVWILFHYLRNPRALLLLTGATMAGLLPYLHLPIAAAAGDGFVWGELSTPSGFFDHLLRREYGTFQLAAGDVTSDVSTLDLISRYIRTSSSRLMLLPVLFAIPGAIFLFRQHRAIAVCFTIGLLSYLIGFQSLCNLSPDNPLLADVLSRFWMMPDLMICLLGGLGFCTLRDRLPRVLFHLNLPLLALASLLHHGRMVEKTDSLFEEYGTLIAAPLDDGDVLFVRGDLPGNCLRYLQAADQLPADIILLDLELMTRSWYREESLRHHPELHFPGTHYHPGETNGYHFAAFVAANAEGRSLWIYPETKTGDGSAAMLSTWPTGFPLQIRPPIRTLQELQTWDQQAEIELQAAEQVISAKESGHPGSWRTVVHSDLVSAQHRYALQWLNIGLAHENVSPALHKARALYEAFTAEHPDAAYAWKNLGIVYQRLPNQEKKLIEAWSRYLDLNPEEDEQTKTIREFVNQSR